jgi:Tfp pilus assembly protein PilF
MKRTNLEMALMGMILCVATTCFGAPVRRALVIGNDTYPGNSLTNARNDARAVSAELTSLGYVTTLVLDASKASLTSTIDKFSTELAHGDTVIVYYAGHGLQLQGENYLVPIDFHVSDETDVSYQGYPLSGLLAKLTEHGATTQVVILDACRDNPFLGSRSVRGGWASIGTSAGSFLAFGTAPGSTASDDPNEGHGLFTKSLLKFLGSSLDVEQMFQRVREDVIRESFGNQVPWTASSLIGAFHVDPNADTDTPLLAGFGAVSQRLSRQSRSQLARQVALSDPPRVKGVDVSEDAKKANLLVQATTEVRGLHFKQALTTLEMVLSIDPRCALALRLIGLVLHLTGRSAEASQAFDQAIQVDPKDALAYSYRCLVKLSSGGDGRADDCKEALTVQNDLYEAHVGLALNSLTQGESDLAMREATRAIAINPTSPVGFLLRGDIATTEEHKGLAQEDYARATAIALEKAQGDH